jgi:hypothetical protein
MGRHGSLPLEYCLSVIAGLDPAIQLSSKTMDARVQPGMTSARGVLVRRCGIGKTPLRAARLCKPRFACHNADQPE